MNAKCESLKNSWNSVCNVIVVVGFIHKLGQVSPPSLTAFHPSGLLLAGNFVVLRRLMDREAPVLLFDGSESFLS